MYFERTIYRKKLWENEKKINNIIYVTFKKKIYRNHKRKYIQYIYGPVNLWNQRTFIAWNDFFILSSFICDKMVYQCATKEISVDDFLGFPHWGLTCEFCIWNVELVCKKEDTTKPLIYQLCFFLFWSIWTLDIMKY